MQIIKIHRPVALSTQATQAKVRQANRATPMAAAAPTEHPTVSAARQALKAPSHPLQSSGSLQRAIAAEDLPAVELHIAEARQPWLDFNGQRPLTLAAVLGRTAMVQRLLRAGASPAESDFFGHTPLHWAELTQQPELAAILREQGAPEGARNAFFATPANCAVNTAPPEPAQKLTVMVGGEPQTWSAEAVRQQLALELLTTSQIDPSWLTHQLSLMADDDMAERVLRFMPRAPLPDGSEAPVALKHYGLTLGWGVCALEPIEAGRFVGSYLGRVTALHNESHEFNAYLATPLACTALGRLRMGIDARHAGNWVSRVNSSTSAQSANLEPREGFRAGVPVLDMWSARPIAAGEQLLWHYGEAYWQRHPTACV